MTERAKSAVKEITRILQKNDGSWWSPACTSDQLGDMIFRAAYKADRYDLYNRLCSGFKSPVAELVRADCRHRLRVGVLFICIIIQVVWVFSGYFC